MQRTSMTRVLGRAVVGGVVVIGAAVVPWGGGTAAADTPAVTPAWSVDTDSPAGLTAGLGGGFVVPVPLDICSVDWTVIGAAGGSSGLAEPGAAGGELRVTTREVAGSTVSLFAGTAGADWAGGGAGGTGGSGAALMGAPGLPDGPTGGGGGGAASTVRVPGLVDLVAHGGAGGGATGGAGGGHPVGPPGSPSSAGPSGNSVLPGRSGPLPVDRAFDGDTDDLGGSGRSGAGRVLGVGTRCPATVPGAPSAVSASSVPEDGVVRVDFQPAAPMAHQVWSPVTGWEVTVDGGVTWQPLATTDRPHGAREGLVRGLADGDHRVAVRATSALGPGASSAVRSVRLVGTPTAVAVSDVSVAAGVSSLRVSWTPPVGGVRGGYVAEAYDAAQDGLGEMYSMCETTVDVHSCVLAAEPGRSYRVVVGGGGGRASDPVTSGVVSAPPVPAQVPAPSGSLRVPASSGGLAPGDAVAVSGAGYLPGSTVTVVVYSTPTVLGSVTTSSADGSFDTTVTLPAGLPAGQHTLVATGVAPDGRTWTLTQAITALGAPGAPATDGPAAGRTPAEGGLAYTGAYTGVMAAGGLGALAAGLLLVLAGRRRRTARQG